MAEDANETTSETEAPATPPEQQEGGTDWKAEARKWEARAKENKAKADKWDEREQADRGELERMTERAQEAERLVEEYRHSEDKRSWAAKVAEETHVPASVLRGETEEEMREHAKAIIGSGLSSYGRLPDSGESGSPAPVTREQIEAIKDPRERVRVRAQHLDLYRH